MIGSILDLLTFGTPGEWAAFIGGLVVGYVRPWTLFFWDGGRS